MIRRVTTDVEVAKVVDLAHVIWHEHFPLVISVDQIDYMLQQFLSCEAIQSQRKQGYDYYMIVDQGRAVGFLSVVDQGQGLHLSKFYILRAFRGRGLARQALDFVEAQCRKQGRGCVWLRVNRENELAVAVYKHMGFNVSGTDVKDIGQGYFMDDYVMTKMVERQ